MSSKVKYWDSHVAIDLKARTQIDMIIENWKQRIEDYQE